MSHLRRKGNLIEGILIPFTTPDKDAYGTYWNRDTDFGLDMFAPHPVLYLHGLRSVDREGTIISFELRDEGLYARAELRDGSPLHALIDSGRAAWSSGAVPHLIKQDRWTGYIRQWILVEGSIGDRSQVAARDGLTKAAYIRSLESIYEGPVKRSLWVGGNMTEQSAVKQEEQNVPQGQDKGQRAAPPLGVQAVQVGALGHQLASVHQPVTSAEEGSLGRELIKTLQSPLFQQALAASIRTELDKQRQAQPAPPARALPPEGDKSPLKMPSIKVASRYDLISPLGMVWHHELNSSMRAYDRNWQWSADEEFMRALVDKVGKLWRTEEKVQDSQVAFGNDMLEVVPMRSITRSAYNAWHERIPYLRAGEAMTSTLANFGDELVPQLFSSVVYYHVRLAAVVAPLFQTFLMPGNPYDVPKITSGPVFHRVAELADSANLDPSAFLTPVSKVGTDKVTFDAGKLMALTETSRELIEDSGINFSQAMANEYVREMAHTLDWALLNGDESDTATNISYYGTKPSTETTMGYSRALAFDGLRSIVDSGDRTDIGGALASDDILTLAKLMGPRGIIGRDLPNLTCIMGPETQYKLESLDDYEGMDKVGDLATLVNGQLGSWRGVPVVVSEDMLLGTSGGNHSATLANNTLGMFALVHRPSILIGMRRMPQIEQVRVPGADGSYITASMRLDVQAMETGGVAVGYNVAV